MGTVLGAGNIAMSKQAAYREEMNIWSKDKMGCLGWGTSLGMSHWKCPGERALRASARAQRWE